MLSRAEFVIKFRSFVADLGRDDRGCTGVGPTDNLFDAGVLDSFTVVQVIVFIEQLTGGPIDLDEASIESFSTMESIYSTFVADRAAPPDPAPVAAADAIDVRRAAR